MSKLETQVESILFFKSEPVSVKELARLLEKTQDEIKLALNNLKEFYGERGIALISNDDEYSFGTSAENSNLIEQLQKDELSRDLGRAGLETLAVILYRGSVARREIDLIRGVNSSFILRSLLIRGLVERSEEGRGFTYKPTLKLLEYLGVESRDNLPEYEDATKALAEFLKSEPKEDESQ